MLCHFLQCYHCLFLTFQIDLMHDRNAEVQKLCDATLDIISLHDDAWRDRVRQGFHFMMMVGAREGVIIYHNVIVIFPLGRFY